MSLEILLTSLFTALGAALVGAVESVAAVSVAPVLPVMVALFIGTVLYLYSVRSKGIRRMPSSPQVMMPLMFFMLALPAMAFAQDTGTPVEASIWTTLVPAIVTILVPLAIALTKKWIPAIPKWLLPILAPLLGAGLAILGDVAAGENVGLIMGAVYGGLGTWLREFIDQLKKAAPAAG